MMVLADFRIVCIGQKKYSDFQSEFFNTDHFIAQKPQMDFEWRVMHSLIGKSYEFSIKQRMQNDFDKYEPFDIGNFINQNTVPEYCDIINKNLLPRDYDYMSSVVILKHLDEIRRIITFYIAQSPINCVTVLFRLQDKEYETIVGVIELNDFFQKLSSGNILYNVAYVITDKRFSRCDEESGKC
jgi:hypothetical protein